MLKYLTPLGSKKEYTDSLYYSSAIFYYVALVKLFNLYKLDGHFDIYLTAYNIDLKSCM